jgi:predicted Zn-dependent protease with MMP-like domain
LPGEGRPDVDCDSFADLVADALDSLPEEFLERMVNVEVTIEDWPSREDLEEAGLGSRDKGALLGLYHGVPLTHRGAFYSALPTGSPSIRSR